MTPQDEQERDPRIGTVIGDRYQIMEQLGVGGMGVVFRAEHVLMKKTVALKLLHPELGRIEEVARRFEREAQSVSRLSHPGIIQVTDFGRTADGVLFLVMEFLPGESVAALLAREGRLPPERAVGIMCQVLAALEHAHAHGVVHRDLKPENIMLTRRVDRSLRDSVKILDFGIAKMSEEAPSAAKPLTQAGVVFGTPWYMSPEQALGEQTDTRSDLYSCAVILHELLSGKRPFEAEQLVQVIAMHITAPPPPLRQAVPEAEVGPSVEAAVLKGLAKSRADRFATAAEFMAALADDAPVSSSTPRPSSMLAVTTDPAGARRLTLTLDLDRLRAEAKGFWQRRSSRARRALVGASATIVLLALALVVRTTQRPAQPKAVPDGIVQALKPAEDAIARGDLPAARALLMQQLSEHPRAARVYYLIGTVDVVDHRLESALEAYRQAIALDPGYRSDVAILRNVRAMAEEKRLGASIVSFLAQDLGDGGGVLLAELASSDKRPEVRQAAMSACEKLRCAKQVDRVQHALLDLAQGKRCEDRREAVLELKELGDPRALEPLRRLRKRGSGFVGLFNNSNDCLKRELDDAVRALGIE